jgi:hypothetical protein
MKSKSLSGLSQALFGVGHSCLGPPPKRMRNCEGWADVSRAIASPWWAIPTAEIDETAGDLQSFLFPSNAVGKTRTSELCALRCLRAGGYIAGFFSLNWLVCSPQVSFVGRL